MVDLRLDITFNHLIDGRRGAKIANEFLVKLGIRLSPRSNSVPRVSL